jgi:hypothetical protein
MNNFQKATLQLIIGFAFIIIYFIDRLIYSTYFVTPIGLIGGIIGATSIYWYLKDDTPISSKDETQEVKEAKT